MCFFCILVCVYYVYYLYMDQVPEIKLTTMISTFLHNAPFPLHTCFHFHAIIYPSFCLVCHSARSSLRLSSFLIVLIHSIISSSSSAAYALQALLTCSCPPFFFSHSTETSLLYIYDRLINAVGSLKLPCLCLFDFCAVFDTIDHNILIIRLLSWFGIHGFVTGLCLTYYIVLSVSTVTKNSLLNILLHVVSLKALFSVLYFSSCILVFTQHSHLLIFSKPPPLRRVFLIRSFLILPLSSSCTLHVSA